MVKNTKGICHCLGKLSYTFASHRKLAEKKQLVITLTLSILSQDNMHYTTL